METKEKKWLEVPVFIHGITTGKDVESHGAKYRRFLAKINAALAKRGKPQFDEDAGSIIMVEWGWKESLGEDRDLAEAERKIAGQVFKKAFPLSLPWKMLRETFLYGFNDLLYYVTEEGERTVRENVFEHIGKKIRLRRVEARARKIPTNLSLTFIAFSAGTVIAHDLLYHLFRENEGSRAEKHEIAVRTLVQQQHIRIRRFYTMGSPIAALSVRTNRLIKRIIEGEKFHPSEIGLLADDGLSNPRWVNFWDKDDIISHPVEFLYEPHDPAAGRNPVIVDKQINLGWLFPKIHYKYWESSQVIDYIAKTFW